MPTSLVTGAAGFIGSHVTRHLRDHGHTVVALDDLSGGYFANVPRDAWFVCGDITDPHMVAAVFDNYSFDYVFHLAAYAAEGLSHFIRRYNYTNNVLGSVNLINEAIKHRVQRFVFTSSMAVYGTNQLPFTEDLTPQPEDPYGIAKLAVELDLHAAHEMFGLDYTIFRPHNVYGEGQNIADRYRNVIGIWMNQLMHDQPMTVFGDGEQTRAFSHVADVAPIIARSVSVPASAGQTFNVGADHYCTVFALAHIVANAFHVEPRITHLPPRVEVRHAYTSHDRVRAVFGETDDVPLEVGIARMATWAKAHGPQPTPQFADIELRGGQLPVGWLD